ncbi:hypothetical protein [Streptomyces sp. CB03238]|uniref:phage tail fiber protein n=1 Tax=Streptomyces sp. CB03238 TaxID=1907777 RepID=UPI000A12186F|nr:hypothetical protein [Streptomyces sp. CB03238]ORT58163.1 hypothetical protein BKD26_19875 [Streptomyces sp. CB03238]
MPGYLTRYASKALLTLMTGGGENAASGTDPVADRLLKAHLIRHMAEPTIGVWAPKAYLLSLLDQVDSQGSAAVRAEIQARPADPSGSLYLALCTSNPGNMATGLSSELTAVGYQRQAVQMSAPKNGAAFVVESATPAQASLSSSVVFGPFTDATGSGGAVTHMALVTAATGTDIAVLAVWPLDSPVTAAQGESLLASAGTLTIKVD